jgi:hypothetical protein
MSLLDVIFLRIFPPCGRPFRWDPGVLALCLVGCVDMAGDVVNHRDHVALMAILDRILVDSLDKAAHVIDL